MRNKKIEYNSKTDLDLKDQGQDPPVSGALLVLKGALSHATWRGKRQSLVPERFSKIFPFLGNSIFFFLK